MAKGTLYGVGVGPGDPKLMTLRAVETIAACPVVAAPRTQNGGMVALDIARGAVDLSGKEILPLDFAMSRDPGERASSHREAAALLRPRLDAGESVAMLNLGDVSIYASFRYLADLLGPEGYPIEMVAGVPSFCAAAAALGIPLTDMDTPLRVIPDNGRESGEEFAPGTTVWMKSGRNLPALMQKLAASGLSGKAMLAQNCGMAEERLYRSLPEGEIASRYFTLVILKNDTESMEQ